MARHENAKKTFTAGEALEAARRVKIKSGTTTDPPEVVYADAGEDFIGVTEFAVSSGVLVTIRLKNAEGTFEVEASSTAAIGAAPVRVSRRQALHHGQRRCPSHCHRRRPARPAT